MVARAQQFELMVADVRALLSLTMGVQKGSVVAVISRNNIEWAACAFATWGLGAVYVPIPEAQVRSVHDSGAAAAAARASAEAPARRAAFGDLRARWNMCCGEYGMQLGV